MSDVRELRDSESAQSFLFQSLWLQRVLGPSECNVREVLEWGIELLSQGELLPPLGFVADVGHVALARDWDAKTDEKKPHLPHVDPNLLSTYEDHVLGKIYADWSFSHAGDALRRYQPGREQAKGLAFILRQIRRRARYGGVNMSPSILTVAREMQPDEILRQGFESLQQDGLHEHLELLLQSLIKGARQINEVLEHKDVIQLQLGTALDPEGERLAFDQTLEAADHLEATLPRHKLRPLARREEVPTRVLDEDAYPVGGFSSLSNRGSVESLLFSQLAYIEEEDQRPDLFDIKYLRGELLYYSRDENQFLRQRRCFVLSFFPGLHDQIHFKDLHLPYQRGILMLGLIYVTVTKLIEWLSTDALQFDFVFLRPDATKNDLQKECDLLERLFREQIANGTVSFHSFGDVQALEQHCLRRSRRNLCHLLAISPNNEKVQPQDTIVTRFRIAGPKPALAGRGEKLSEPEVDEPLDSWVEALREVLQRWI